jgi:hypothetical protein
MSKLLVKLTKCVGLYFVSEVQITHPPFFINNQVVTEKKCKPVV